MKWFLGILSITCILASCDNELIVTDNWKDIPVVWGLLSKSDTAHYIRVEKAYLDPTTSALEIAQRVDSLYYDDAVVSLRRVSSGEIFPMDRINGDLEGYPRQGGIFANSPNYLYKIKANEINLVVGESYEFLLNRGDGKPLVTAETIVLPKPVLRNPTPSATLNFRPKSSFNFKWDPIDVAGVFDLLIYVHYRERSPETGNFYVPKSFEWVVKRNLLDRETQIDGTEFYAIIKDNLEVDPEAERLFDSLNIVIWAGGDELTQFIEIAQANRGLTSTQDIPTYTNLSPEGVGIFSSRNVSINTGFGITNQTLDSLRDGSITKTLNFN